MLRRGGVLITRGQCLHFSTAQPRYDSKMGSKYVGIQAQIIAWIDMSQAIACASQKIKLSNCVIQNNGLFVTTNLNAIWCSLSVRKFYSTPYSH
uniref:Pectinesterase n=1 Tax=Rhizophora mucronata TaxID=61149 RepID=A0A2P2J0F5_RHIMU